MATSMISGDFATIVGKQLLLDANAGIKVSNSMIRKEGRDDKGEILNRALE